MQKLSETCRHYVAIKNSPTIMFVGELEAFGELAGI